MTWDPREQGAACDRCILGPKHVYKAKLRARSDKWNPVAAEINEGAVAAWVGEAPGEEEEERGRPFVGKSGMRADQALRVINRHRGHLTWINVASCRMGPTSDHDRVKSVLRKVNRKREADGLAPLLDPLHACWPRFAKEIKPYKRLIPVGGSAVKAVLNNDKASVMALRGGTKWFWRDANGMGFERKADAERIGEPPLERVQMVATVHPAATLPGRSPRMTQWLMRDVAKAFRWFEGRLNWKDPRTIINPRPSQLADFIFNQDHEWLLVDVESVKDTEFWAKPAWNTKTEFEKLQDDYGWDPLTDKLRCIGVGNQHVAYVIMLKSVDGVTEFYPAHEQRQIQQIFIDWLNKDATRGPIPVGHNYGWYDLMVLERYIGGPHRSFMDTILLHRLVESEFPHGLGFIGSLYTDAPSWKADKTATTARSDKELAEYNACDIAINSMVVNDFVQRTIEREQDHLIPIDHRIQEACVWMHKTGLLVDKRRQQWWEQRCEREAIKWAKRVRVLAGDPNFSPGSPLQVADLLFNKWAMPVVKLSDKTGDPSTDKEVLVKLYVDPATTDRQKRFIHALRRYRRVRNKLLSTYIRPLKPISQNGVLWPDGRLRTGWNAHVTVSGRLSSSDPVNLQNQPIFIRDLYWAQEGCVIVSADQDQLELKNVSALAGIRVYLEAFEKGWDPHSLTAVMVFGDAYRNADGYTSDTTKPYKGTTADRMRDFAKRVCYAMLYGASPETVYMQVVGAENDRGDLIFAGTSKRQVKLACRRLLEAIPELPRWWEKVCAFWREHGYVESAISKRRRDCLDGEELNTLVNHPSQCTAADLMNEITIELMDEIGFEPWGPGTGLIFQVHDSLGLEVPVSKAEWAKDFLTDLMTRRYDALPGVTYAGAADISRRWDGIKGVYN